MVSTSRRWTLASRYRFSVRTSRCTWTHSCCGGHHRTKISALHNEILNSFNHLGFLVKRGQTDEAKEQLIIASECDEVGLGVSAHRTGVRIGEKQAREILDLFARVPEYDRRGFTHFEEIQFFVDGVAKDRISDFACSFMKSFLIDFTIDECEQHGIPLTACKIPHIYDPKKCGFAQHVPVQLPVNPETGTPILLVPKRWLRFGPWLDFDEYFRSYCPQDEAINPGAIPTRVRVLRYNRENYGTVEAYVRRKEATAADCKNDPSSRNSPSSPQNAGTRASASYPPGKSTRPTGNTKTTLRNCSPHSCTPSWTSPLYKAERTRA